MFRGLPYRPRWTFDTAIIYSHRNRAIFPFRSSPDTMHFYPTISEVNESRSNGSMTDLSSDPSDLTREHLYVSGSRWGHRYVKALRVQLISPVSPDRIFPSKFLPSDDDPAMQSCFRYIENVADDARSFQRVEN